MDLLEARTIKRINQWDLRKATGIHQSKISLIENGYIDATADEKAKIAGALGFSVHELFQSKKEDR